MLKKITVYILVFLYLTASIGWMVSNCQCDTTSQSSVTACCSSSCTDTSPTCCDFDVAILDVDAEVISTNFILSTLPFDVILNLDEPESLKNHHKPSLWDSPPKHQAKVAMCYMHCQIRI